MGNSMKSALKRWRLAGLRDKKKPGLVNIRSGGGESFPDKGNSENRPLTWE